MRAAKKPRKAKAPTTTAETVAFDTDALALAAAIDTAERELYQLDAELHVLRDALDTAYEPGSVVVTRISARLCLALEALARPVPHALHMAMLQAGLDALRAEQNAPAEVTS